MASERWLSIKRWWRFNYRYWQRTRPPWDTGVSPPELYAFINSHPAGRALDLGCGTGTNAITLARHGWQVTGVDFAWRAIQLARQKARAAGVAVDFRLGDVTRLGWLAGPFDLIFDLGCFHGLPAGGQLAYARHVQRLLAPDGTFLLYVMFRAEVQTNQVGIIESDLGCFAPALRLIHRADGTDATRGCPAAWLTYQRRH